MNNLQYGQGSERLRFIIDNGMKDIGDVQNSMETMKREELLKKHPYKTWQGKDGKWYTYLPDELKKDGRRLIKRTTEECIHIMLVKYYEKQEKVQKVTFKYAYDGWLEAHSISFSSDNTLVKYETDYKPFFKGRDIESIDIKLFNEENVKRFIVSLCKEKQLAPKACKTLCGYMRNTFKSAKIHKDITESPFDNLETKQFYQYCTRKVKTPEQRTISNNEFKMLYAQFQLDYHKHPDYIPAYAVEFASLTGFRVEEISALMWENIKNGMTVVNKSEKYNRVKKEYWIGSAKNRKERYMLLTDEIVELLMRIKNVQRKYGFESEYIFANRNGRAHASVISV